MKKLIFLAGLIVGLLLIPSAVYFYFAAGFAPVATSAPPMPFEESLAKKALHARLEKEMPPKTTLAPTEAALLAGVDIYRLDCAVCHGLPGESKTPIAEGMYPPPPQLFLGKGVTDEAVEEIYWVVANGIRLTGMPAFRTTLTDQQLWEVSLLLAKANELPTAVKSALTKPDTPAATEPGAAQ